MAVICMYLNADDFWRFWSLEMRHSKHMLFSFGCQSKLNEELVFCVSSDAVSLKTACRFKSYSPSLRGMIGSFCCASMKLHKVHHHQECEANSINLFQQILELSMPMFSFPMSVIKSFFYPSNSTGLMILQM